MAAVFGNTFECTNCDKFVDERSKVVLHCEHELCINCLLQTAINAVSKEVVEIQCPIDSECTVLIEAEIFQPFLEPKLYQKLEAVLKNMNSCPKCLSTSETDLDCFFGSCTSCDYIFCTNCKHEYHGFECEMEQETNLPFGALEYFLAELMEFNELALEHYILENQQAHDQNGESFDECDSKFDCCICLNKVELEDSVDFGCEHTSACRDCVKDFFENYINNGQIYELKCPEPGCGQEASQSLIKEIVDAEVFFKLEDFFLNDALKDFPEIVLCPNADCQRRVVAEPEYGYCNHCDFRFCTECNQAFHGTTQCGMSESEMRERVKQYLAADEEERRRMDEEEKKVRKQQDIDSEVLIKNIYKKCPTCHIDIEKTMGCNKMQCTKCNSFFCWLCGIKITEQDPYKHFGGNCALFEVPPE